MPEGKLNSALMAAEPSPVKPAVPLPRDGGNVAGHRGGAGCYVSGKRGARLDHADAAVAVLDEVHVAGGIHGQRVRRPDLGARARRPVPGPAHGAVAGVSVDDAAGVDLADAAVLGIGDVDVAGRIEGHVFGAPELGIDGLAGVAEEAGVAVAGDGVDVAVGGDFADDVVGGVGDVNIVGGIDRQAGGQMEEGGGGGSAVTVSAGTAAGADGAGAGEGADDAVGRDHAHAVVAGIGDIKVAVAIEHQAVRAVQLGRGGGAAVAGEAGARIARHQRQGSGRRQLEHRVGGAEIDVAGLIQRDAVGLADGDVGGRNGGSRRRAAGHGGDRVLLCQGSGAGQQAGANRDKFVHVRSFRVIKGTL